MFLLFKLKLIIFSDLTCADTYFSIAYWLVNVAVLVLNLLSTLNADNTFSSLASSNNIYYVEETTNLRKSVYIKDSSTDLWFNVRLCLVILLASAASVQK